ncbi:MAG: hypothetical protein ACW96M_07070, partial [Candidatus Thorarchaeota archaeon]
MPISTGEKSGGIPVKIYPKTGEISRGMIFYKKEGPFLKLNSGDVLDESEGVIFSFIEDSFLARFPKLDSDSQIIFKPEIVVESNFSPDRFSRFEMYPPSTDSWLAHVVNTGIKSIFTIQRIIDNDKRLLTIVNESTLELYHLGLIQPYESSILSMNRDWNIHNEIIYSDVIDADIFSILKKKSLSWPTLSKLVEGVPLQDLAIQKTMQETLNQLVPQSFPSNIRIQIMAFLGWLEKA